MIEVIIQEAKDNALPFLPSPATTRTEPPLIAQTAMRLTEVVAGLNKILDACTNDIGDLKLKPKKWKWVREKRAIENLRDKARDTKCYLQTAIQLRTMSMIQNLHANQMM